MMDRHIRFQARVRPLSAAVVSLGGQTSFAEFDADIDRMAAELATLDPPRAGLVAVRLADPYAHWLVLLALSRLGLASASFGAFQSEHTLTQLAPDLTITDTPLQAPAAGRVVHASPEWIATALRRPAVPMPAVSPHPDAVCRVASSSGTTGLPKKIAMSWRACEGRVMRMAMQTQTDEVLSRTLTVIGPESGSWFSLIATWSLGGAALIASPAPAALAAALPRLRPTSLSTAPIQLKALLDALPATFLPMPELSIFVAGGHTSRAVLTQARLRLTSKLWIIYGSTEGGMIAEGHTAALAHDDAAVGWAFPWADLQVVDEADAPVAAGVSGRLRVRGEDCVTQYLDDEAATQRNFKDGWFYPGDIASLSADGLLRVEGRVDEVMNFGGEKFLPRTLEEAVLGCQGVHDAGAFTMTDAEGALQPWVALVRGEEADEAAIGRALTIPGLPPVHVAWIADIPRNALGKVQRDRLQQAARALIGARGPASPAS